MALEARDVFTVEQSLSDARERVLASLVDDGARLRSQGDEYIEVQTGSVVRLRLLGALGTRSRRLPLKTRVVFGQAGDVIEIRTIMTDRAGPGLRTGLHGRYKERLNEVAAVVRKALDVHEPPVLG